MRNADIGFDTFRDRERGREQHDVLARADGQGRQIEGGAAGRPAGVQEIDTQIYGNAFTAKMSLDRQIVGRCVRMLHQISNVDDSLSVMC